MLVLETFMVGVFAARDVFLFYVFFEAMLIPVYFLIGQFGGAQRRYAAVKFLLYSLFGGLVMLVAVIGVYFQGKGGPQGFLTTQPHRAAATRARVVERLLFLGFFLAFAIKAPMWPVHTWLPDAAAEAPAGVAVLLVGVLDKVGTFGMITLCLPLFPNASQVGRARRPRPRRRLGRSTAGCSRSGRGTSSGSSRSRRCRTSGSSCSGSSPSRARGRPARRCTWSTTGSRRRRCSWSPACSSRGGGRSRSTTTAVCSGRRRCSPGPSWSPVSPALALPGLSSFISEFLVLVGTFTRYPAAAVVATLGIVLASLYILLTYQRMFTGPGGEFAAGWRDMNAREAWVVAPLVAVIVALGFYPKPVLDVLNPAVGRTMQQTSSNDPAPTVPGVTPAAAEGTAP